MLLHLFLVTTFSSIMIIESGQLENYGPYKVVWNEYMACKGPKQRDCAKFEIKNWQNMSDIVYHFELQRDCVTTMAKVVVSNNKNNVTKKLYNYVLNKPCEHFVLGPVLVEVFNLTKTCKISKGVFDFHLDYKTKAIAFLGKNFFFGNYNFKIMAYNKEQNLFCIDTNLDLFPLDKN